MQTRQISRIRLDKEHNMTDRTLDPAAALALAESQGRDITARIAAFVPRLLIMWSVIWLLGFGLLWLVDGGEPHVDVPLPIAVAGFGALMLVGIAVSAVFGIRSGRGIRSAPRSAFPGVIYGTAWPVGAIALGALGGALGMHGMSDELGNVYYPVVFTIFTGLMWIFAGALWRAVPAVIVGWVTVALAIAAAFVGAPHHYFVLALGGFLAFLSTGIVLAVRSR
jgi:hypothetical protein